MQVTLQDTKTLALHCPELFSVTYGVVRLPALARVIWVLMTYRPIAGYAESVC